MKKLTHLQQQLVNLILYKPQDLRKVLAQVTDPTYALRFLDYLLPYRVGVEIDIAGLPREFEELLKKRFCTPLPRIKSLINFESTKYPLVALEVEQATQVRNMNTTVEIKMSFKKITQLKYFKELLSNLESHALKTNPDVGLAINGGLHIHIGAGTEGKSIKRDRLSACRMSLFKYFKTMVFGLSSTMIYGDEIQAYRHHNTLEYRLGIPTFNYTKIMRWTLCCEVLNRSIRLGVPFNKELTDAILAS